jgi:hypothetical protein
MWTLSDENRHTQRVRPVDVTTLVSPLVCLQREWRGQLFVGTTHQRIVKGVSTGMATDLAAVGLHYVTLSTLKVSYSDIL